MVSAAVVQCYVAQGACRTEVTHGVTRCMAEHVVSHRDECIFLAKHCSVFADEGQSVNIWIDNNAKVVPALLYLIHYIVQVLLQWLGVVGELSCWFGVKNGVFYAQLVE